MSATKEAKKKKSIFYTPKDADEMREYLKKMSMSIPEEARICCWTAVCGLNQYFENLISERDGEEKKWI